MYLIEAARLCQHQNQSELARRLFRQSHDLLINLGSDSVKREITAQSLMLCANSYDQG